MKTKLIIISLISIIVLATSCNKNQIEIYPSENVTSVEKTLVGSPGLKVSGLFNVHVNFSETEEKIILEANENIQSQIQVKEINGTLIIELKDRVNIKGSNLVLNAYITTNRINDFNISGGSSVELRDDMHTENMEIMVSGASQMSGAVNTDYLYAELSGASEIDLSGISKEIFIKSEGASVLKNYGFQSEYLEADLSGASKVYTTINHQLDVKATGGSCVYYKGNGIISNQNLSGASEIIKVD